MKWIIFFLALMVAVPFVSAVIFDPVIRATYIDTAGACSTEGIYDMQSNNTHLVVASATDDTVSIFSRANAENLSCSTGYTDSLPPGSVDDVRRTYYDSSRGLLYAAAFTDDALTILNVTGATPTALGSTATIAVNPGSLDGAWGVTVKRYSDSNVLAMVSASIDDTLSVYNVTNPSATPTYVSHRNTSANPCSTDDIRFIYNINGTDNFLYLSEDDDVLSSVTINAAGTITCLTQYTDSVSPNSVDGAQHFFYEESTDLVYVAATIDSELTILNLTNPSSIVAVGGLTGLTAANEVIVFEESGTKYAAVGSTTAGIGVYFVNVTNPASPSLIEKFNDTSGACTWLATRSFVYHYPYLYAAGGTGTNSCLYSVQLFSEPAEPDCDEGNLTCGLIAYVTANSGVSNSTQANDTSGNNNHGTVFGSLVYDSTIQAYNASTWNQRLNFANTTSLQTVSSTNSMTVSLWVKMDRSIQYAGFPDWFYLPNSTGGRAWLAYYNNGSVVSGSSWSAASTYTDGTIASSTLMNTVNATDWSHIVYTAKGCGSPTMTAYINNPTSNTQTPPDCELFEFLEQSNSSFRLMNNQLASYREVRVYNRSLTAAEVATLYAGGAYMSSPADVGETYNDQSGNNRNFSQGGERLTDDSQYIYFDGTNELVNSTNNFPIMDNSNTWCVSGWVKWDEAAASGGHQNIITYRFDFGANQGWLFKVAGFSGDAWQFLTGNVAATFSHIAVNNVWQHFVISYNGSHLHGWANGTLDVNQTIAMKVQDSANNICIGSECGSQYFAGGIDNLVFFNTSCTQAQVTSLFNNETTAFPNNLAMWYPFETAASSWSGGGVCGYSGSGDWTLIVDTTCSEVVNIGDNNVYTAGYDLIVTAGGRVHNFLRFVCQGGSLCRATGGGRIG